MARRRHLLGMRLFLELALLLLLSTSAADAQGDSPIVCSAGKPWWDKNKVIWQQDYMCHGETSNSAFPRANFLFPLNVPSANATTFEVLVNVTVLEPLVDTFKFNLTGDDCRLWTSDVMMDKATLSVSFGSAYAPIGKSAGVCPAGPNASIGSSILCFPKYEHQNLSLLVTMGYPARLSAHIGLRRQLRDFEVNGTLINWPKRADLGGPHGSAYTVGFDINSDAGPWAYERVLVERVGKIENLDAMSKEDISKHVVHAFVFPGNSPCIQHTLERGGCAYPELVISCISSGSVQEKEPSALHMTFINSVDLTLSSESLPKRAAGRWFVLLACTHSGTKRCPVEAFVISHRTEGKPRVKLVVGALFMFFAPFATLFLVDLAFYESHRLLEYLARRRGEECGNDRRFRPHIRHAGGIAYNQLVKNLSILWTPEPHFTSLLMLMLGIFLSLGFQFIVLRYMDLIYSGDRDTCFYNEKCYYPAFGLDIPMNNLISHLAYFVAGLHVYLQATMAEGHCAAFRKQAEKAIDLRPLYAIAGSFIGEGLGSMCYHVCPSVSAFQFDTCFMIPIAHLCTTALAKWDDDASSWTIALKYFLYIITPIWIFNFIGTWYDIGEFDSTVLYLVFAVCLVAWGYLATQSFDVFFDDKFRSDRLVRKILKALVIFVLTLAVVPRFTVPGTSFEQFSIRASLGGMANTMLLLSLIMMMIIVGRQIYDQQLRHQECTSWSLFKSAIQYQYFFMLVVVGFVAVKCFNEKVNSVVPGAGAAQSHEANTPCAFLIFDLHDMWHFLSAIGLALFGMMLLDVKVGSWARELGVSFGASSGSDSSDADEASSDRS